jgi:3-oxoacyl-[acyl-carrier protein] reductase
MSLVPDSVLLTDRFVVVTGAAQGIGAAVAGACARFGADLALCDRDADGLARTAADVEAAGRAAVTAVLDVRAGDAVREWVDTLDRIDVLVNNAGGGFRADFLDVNDKGQDSLVQENFTSVTNFVRASVPHMPNDGRASIVNITSIEAHRAAPGFAVYSAMKAALANLTKTLALELGGRRIRVNCIAPDVRSPVTSMTSRAR